MSIIFILYIVYCIWSEVKTMFLGKKIYHLRKFRNSCSFYEYSRTCFALYNMYACGKSYMLRTGLWLFVANERIEATSRWMG